MCVCKMHVKMKKECMQEKAGKKARQRHKKKNGVAQAAEKAQKCLERHAQAGTQVQVHACPNLPTS